MRSLGACRIAPSGLSVLESTAPRRNMMTKETDANEVEHMAGPKVLNELARLFDETKGRTDRLNGTLGEAIKAAAEKKHLHARAFKDIMKMRRMGANDPLGLASYTAALDHYRKHFKIDEMAASQLALEEEGDKDAPKNGRGKSKDKPEV